MTQKPKNWNLQRSGVVLAPADSPELIEVGRASTLHAEIQRLYQRIAELERATKRLHELERANQWQNLAIWAVLSGFAAFVLTVIRGSQ